MSFTIYTISDPATVGSALTSMAMFFGQESWVGSALKTALMVSLLIILAKGVMREGLRLDVMLIQLLVITVAFIPKTTVTVEQFDNAAPPRMVDGVPYAIAMPGAIAGAFALYMTQKIETVMTGVNGKYISVSGDTNPFTPARMLMSFAACPADPLDCIDRNLAETMRLGARYCGGADLMNARFEQKKDVLVAFADSLTVNGKTIIYTADSPFMSGGGGGYAASCNQSAQHIRGLALSLSDDSPGVFKEKAEGLVNSANISKYSANAAAGSGEKINWPNALATINMVTDDSAKIDTRAIANVMTYAVADSLRYEANAPLSQAVSIKRDMGLFEWAKSEASQSMLVSATAPKFMDVLFFVFIAATPIVMFVVAANPVSGMKVAGSYVLFGIWTQSWIPMMAIITAWYQTEIMNFAKPSLADGVSVEYVASLMRHVNTSTIAAANMIQSAPYMMFAIMSGSMFALSSLIAKAAPSGQAAATDGGMPGAGAGGGGGGSKGGLLGVPGPGGGAPSGAAQQAHMDAGGAVISGPGLGSGGFAGSGNVESAMGAGVLPNFSSTAGSQIANAAADTQAAEAVTSATKSAEATWGKLFSMAKAGAIGVNSANTAAAMKSSGYTVSDRASTSSTDTSGTSTALDKSAGTRQASNLSAKGSASIDAAALLGMAGGVIKSMSGAKGGASKGVDAAARSGSLANLQALQKNASQAYASGDAVKGAALTSQFQSAAAAHDAKFESAGGGLLAQVGDVLGKAVSLQLSGEAGIARTNDNGVRLTNSENGGHTDQSGTGRDIVASSSQRNDSGKTAAETKALTETGSQIESASAGTKMAMQTAETAKSAQSLTRTATQSAGTSAESRLNGAALVTAFANEVTKNNNGAASPNMRSAISAITGAIGSALGSRGGEFQSAVESNSQRLMAEGKGSTMSVDQIAAASAVQALNSMMQSGDGAKATAGLSALTRMASVAGMTTGVDGQAMSQVAALNNEVAGKIQATNESLKPQAEEMNAKVVAGMNAAPGVQAAALGQIGQAGTAANDFANLNGANGAALIGDKLVNALADDNRVKAGANNPQAYADSYGNAVDNMQTIPNAAGAPAFVSGRRPENGENPSQEAIDRGANAIAVAKDVATGGQPAGQMTADAIATSQNMQGLTPVMGGAAAVIGAVARNVSAAVLNSDVVANAVGAGGKVAGEVAGAVPKPAEQQPTSASSPNAAGSNGDVTQTTPSTSAGTPAPGVAPVAPAAPEPAPIAAVGAAATAGVAAAASPVAAASGAAALGSSGAAQVVNTVNNISGSTPAASGGGDAPSGGASLPTLGTPSGPPISGGGTGGGGPGQSSPVDAAAGTGKPNAKAPGSGGQAGANKKPVQGR